MYEVLLIHVLGSLELLQFYKEKVLLMLKVFIFGQLVCSSKSPVCPNLLSTHFCYKDIFTSNLKIKHGISSLHD